MEQTVSDLGLNSQVSGSGRPKHSISTKQDSRSNWNNSSLDSNSDPTPHQLNLLKNLQAHIQQIEQAQQQLQAKFQKVVTGLSKEIQEKEETNSALGEEIAGLKQELGETKQDLSIIVSYLNKRSTKKAEAPVRKTLLNSTKNSGKLEKSASGGKAGGEVAGGAGKYKPKSRSPRMLLLKKSANKA